MRRLHDSHQDVLDLSLHYICYLQQAAASKFVSNLSSAAQIHLARKILDDQLLRELNFPFINLVNREIRDDSETSEEFTLESDSKEKVFAFGDHRSGEISERIPKIRIEVCLFQYASGFVCRQAWRDWKSIVHI